MKKIISILLVSVLFLTGCSTSSAITYNFDDVTLLTEAEEDYLISPKTIEYGKENKVPYIEMVWDFLNHGALEYDVEISQIQLDGVAVSSSEAIFEKEVRVSPEGNAEWKLRIQKEGIDDAQEVSFEAQFNAALSRIYRIRTSLNDRKSYDFFFDEITPKVEVPSDVTIEKTEWGNDEYGYITLDSSWHDFKTIDVSAEANANMLQWQSADMRKIVTMTVGNNTPEGIIAGVSQSEEEGTYSVQFVGGEGFDYDIGVFVKYYEEDNSILAIYAFSTDQKDKSYYLAIEGYEYDDLEVFVREARDIFFTHTELLKTSFLLDVISSNTESKEEETVEEYHESTYPVFDYYTEEKIIDINVIDGFYVDMTSSDESTCVLNKNDSYDFIWIHGFPNDDINDVIKNGKINEEYYTSYEIESSEMIEEKELSNGLKRYVLEMKLKSKEYDIAYDRYYVSVQKDEDFGISYDIEKDELEEMGIASIQELNQALFGE